MPIPAIRIIKPTQERNFGRFGDAVEVPSLTDVQTKSYDRFLQLFDEGRFINAQGETVVCSNVLIVATSNAGAEVYREPPIGFYGARPTEELTRFSARLPLRLCMIEVAEVELKLAFTLEVSKPKSICFIEETEEISLLASTLSVFKLTVYTGCAERRSITMVPASLPP